MNPRAFRYAYYLGQAGVFFSVGLVASISVTYFLFRHLTVGQVGIMWSVYLFSVMVLDFPTGFLADRIGRIRCWGLGLLLTGIGQLLMGILESYPAYLSLAVVGALGEAMMSGSLIAWTVNQAKKVGEEESLPRVFGTGRLISSIVRVAGGAFAGFLAIRSLSWPYLAAGLVAILVAAAALLFIRDDLERATILEPHGARGMVIQFFQNYLLVALAILSIMTLSMHSLYQLFWQPRFLAVGVSPQWIGPVYSAGILALGIGSYSSGAICRGSSLSKLSISLFSGTTMALGILSLGYSRSLWSMVLGILAYNLAFGLFFPVFETWSNEQFSDARRAAANSLMSTVSCSGVAIVQAGLALAYEHMTAGRFALLSLLFLGVAVGTIGWMFALRSARVDGEAAKG